MLLLLSHSFMKNLVQIFLWLQAMKEEIDTIERNDTWELCELSKGKKVIGSKLVYKIKCKSDENIERYKERLVVKAFRHQYGVDFEETIALVARQEIISLVLFGCKQNLDYPTHGYLECLSQCTHLWRGVCRTTSRLWGSKKRIPCVQTQESIIWAEVRSKSLVYKNWWTLQNFRLSKKCKWAYHVF